MKATVLQDFDYSPDGVRIVRLRKGEGHEIRPDLFPGLIAARIIEAVAIEKPAAIPAPAEAPAEAAETAQGSTEAESGVDPAAEAAEGASDRVDAAFAPLEGERATDPLDALDALEAGEVEKPVVRHIGKGRYAIFRGDERLTPEPMTKDAAEAALAAMIRE